MNNLCNIQKSYCSLFIYITVTMCYNLNMETVLHGVTLVSFEA